MAVELDEQDIELIKKALEDIKPGFMESNAKSMATEQRIKQVIEKLEQ